MKERSNSTTPGPKHSFVVAFEAPSSFLFSSGVLIAVKCTSFQFAHDECSAAAIMYVVLCLAKLRHMHFPFFHNFLLQITPLPSFLFSPPVPGLCLPVLRPLNPFLHRLRFDGSFWWPMQVVSTISPDVFNVPIVFVAPRWVSLLRINSWEQNSRPLKEFWMWKGQVVCHDEEWEQNNRDWCPDRVMMMRSSRTMGFWICISLSPRVICKFNRDYGETY